MNTSITSKQKDRLRDVCASFGRSGAELILKNVEFNGDSMQAFLGRSHRLKRAMVEAAVVEAKKLSTAPGLLEPVPFVPAAFVGVGWDFAEPQDEQSLALKRLDPLDVAFGSFLNEGQSVITGEERLTRSKATKSIRLDARWFMSLWEEEGYKTLKWFFTTQGVEWIEFLGSPLRNPRGRRCSLVLCRFGVGTCYWVCNWLGSGRDADHHAAVLAS